MDKSSVVVCNADSGIALEVSWLKKNGKIVFITSNQDINNSFIPESKYFLPIVNSPTKLYTSVIKIYNEDCSDEKRNVFLDRVFGEKNNNYLELAMEKILMR